MATDVCEQKAQRGRGDLHAQEAAAVGLEGENAGWASAARFAVADGANDVGLEQIGNYLGNGRRAQARGAHQVSARTGARFTEKMQKDAGIGVAQKSGP